MQKLIISLICCLLPALAAADTLTIQPNAPDRYVVVKGDTLWDISAKFFKDPWKWPQIWGLNREAIKNPHWIYPGDVVILNRQSKTISVVGQNAPPEGPPPTPSGNLPSDLASAAAVGGTAAGGAPVDRSGLGVRIKPRIRVEPGTHDAVPSIPFADIKPFLNKSLVVRADAFEDAPVIIAGFEHSLLSNHDVAYVRHLPGNKGRDWEIFHRGEALIDPITQDVLGYQATFLGDARVVKFGKTSIVRIYNATQEISPGDKLVQEASEFPENYIPRAPDTDISARVIKIIGGLVMTGPQMVVIINKGRRDGLQNGHVLALYRKGETVDPTPANGEEEAVTLPSVRYGLGFVFRTFDRVSYMLVMQARMPVRLMDVAKTP